MTPYKLVQLECANCVDNLCIRHFDGKCLIAQKKRCEYFERCLLGLPDMRGLKNAERYKTATDEYRRKIMKCGYGNAQDTRRCACGASLPARKRMCEKCTARKRREAYRKSKAKQRSKTLSLLTSPVHS